MNPQASAREIDVGVLLAERPLGRFHALAFGLCLLTLVVTGLNFSALNVAAPEIVLAFGIDRGAMGPVFSWGFVGILVGSVGCGYVGDRFGRKPAILLAVLVYGVASLLTLFAGSVAELALYRALVGFGLGGVVPNVAALLNETAPKRYKVSAVMAAFIGYSTGNATSAQIATWFIPAYGWPVVFHVAGIASLALVIVLLLALPESIPYLTATRPEAPRLRRLVARMAPEIPAGPDTRFIYARPKSETEFSLKLLFTGMRRIATPLIWLAFFAESFTYMTLTAWLVIVLEGLDLPSADAKLAYSYAQLTAIAAILLTARLVDRYGTPAAAASAVIAVTAIVAIGAGGLPPIALMAVAAIAVAFASATHQALIGTAGAFYPTVIRGNGLGYASGMGRVAAILGPSIVGYLIARLPLETVLVIIAAPDLVVAAVCIALHHWARKERAEPARPLGPAIGASAAQPASGE